MDRTQSQEEELNKTKSIDIQTPHYGENWHQESSIKYSQDGDSHEHQQEDEEGEFEGRNRKGDGDDQDEEENNQNDDDEDEIREREDENNTDSDSHTHRHNHQNVDIGIQEDETLITQQPQDRFSQGLLKIDLSSQNNKETIQNDYSTKSQLREQPLHQQQVVQPLYPHNQNNNLQSDPAFAISDRKVWAVSGEMRGSVSKKFVRNYKLGRYNKLKSLKLDMEYFNSPHHEQLHLGNNILPFQNNKNRLFTTGSFDYTKFISSTGASNHSNTTLTSRANTSQNKQGLSTLKSQSTFRSTQMKHAEEQKVYSPRTTANTIMHQIYNQQPNGHFNSIASNQQQSPSQPPPLQMEIRYIDIISQPIVKQANFINNMKCPHGMTNMRSSDKKNIFFFNQQNSNKNLQSTDILKLPTTSPKGHSTQSGNFHGSHLNQLNNPSTPMQSYSKLIGGEGSGYNYESNDNFAELFHRKRYKANDFFGEENMFDHEGSGNNSSYNQYYHNQNNGINKQNIVFQPQNVLLSQPHNKQHQKSLQLTQYSTTTHNNFFGTTTSNVTGGRKFHKTNSKSTTNNANQLRLPLFASNPDNISFFPKAKQNLVKYVNEIAKQDNPLRNTFVKQKQIF